MTQYTIKNLKDVDDAAAKFGLAPALEARFGRKDLEGEIAAVSYERLDSDFRVPFGHKHRDQEEIYVLVNGSGRIKLDDEVHELSKWDVVRVHGDTMRALEAGPDGAEFIVFGAPIGKENDSEIVPGWWSD